MRSVVLIMTGIGFTFGIIVGLFLQLPVETLPADDTFVHSSLINVRYRRSLHHAKDPATGLKLIQSKEAIFKSVSLGSQQNRISQSDPLIEINPIVTEGNRQHSIVWTDVNRKQRLGDVDQKVASQLRKNTLAEDKGEPKIRGVSPDVTLDSPNRVRNSDQRELHEGGKHAAQTITVQLRVSGAGKINNGIKTENSDTGKHNEPPNTGSNSKEFLNLDKVVSGIYWNSHLEESCPRGFGSSDFQKWQKKTNDLKIVQMEEGCGRMQNRLLTLNDASKACARYRLNVDQIQGEIYSYYLANLLNISNLAPTVLLSVDSLDPKWEAVHLDLSHAHWQDGKVVILTQWESGLSPAFIPHSLREDNRKLHPTDDILRGLSPRELCELVQWSDLIVFDYLTANLDRVVNNMFNRQWNDQIMSSATHNLEDGGGDRGLIFLDNESGLFHGYRLLDKYDGFHKQLLGSLCIFRRSTALRIKQLHQSDSIAGDLQRLFAQSESLHSRIPRIPEKNIKILKNRVQDVYKQITECESQYGS